MKLNEYYFQESYTQQKWVKYYLKQIRLDVHIQNKWISNYNTHGVFYEYKDKSKLNGKIYVPNKKKNHLLSYKIKYA